MHTFAVRLDCVTDPLIQSIRKWTAVMLDAAGIARDHVLFKEIFGIVTKGSYFGLVSCF